VARIVIADDSAVMRIMLRKILTELGHEVIAETAILS
jgi:CheY-like chemotaxis protein